jgi:hypothetical protein
MTEAQIQQKTADLHLHGFVYVGDADEAMNVRCRSLAVSGGRTSPKIRESYRTFAGSPVGGWVVELDAPQDDGC